MKNRIVVSFLMFIMVFSICFSQGCNKEKALEASYAVVGSSLESFRVALEKDLQEGKLTPEKYEQYGVKFKAMKSIYEQCGTWLQFYVISQKTEEGFKASIASNVLLCNITKEEGDKQIELYTKLGKTELGSYYMKYFLAQKNELIQVARETCKIVDVSDKYLEILQNIMK